MSGAPNTCSLTSPYTIITILHHKVSYCCYNELFIVLDKNTIETFTNQSQINPTLSKQRHQGGMMTGTLLHREPFNNMIGTTDITRVKELSIFCCPEIK